MRSRLCRWRIWDKLETGAVDGEAGKPLSYGFKIASYDPAYPLVIDPTLDYSTFLGGSGHDAGTGIAVDASGAAHIIGTFDSLDFPLAGPTRKRGHSRDVFVVKLSEDGKSLAYAAFLGGRRMDFGNGIAVDGEGCAYVTGGALSSDFPITGGLQNTRKTRPAQ